MNKFISVFCSLSFIVLLSSCGNKDDCNSCPDWSKVDTETKEQKA